jgi:transcriptional regulator with XRE-family HTH domain
MLQRSPSNVAFGRALRAIREERSAGVDDTARAAGIAVDDLRRLEEGHYAVRLDTIFRLAHGLGVQAAELVGRAERYLPGGPHGDTTHSV